MPWRAAASNGWPVNAQTGNRYTGGNVLMFWCAGVDRGYTSSRWATFKQWQALGAHVRKGETGTIGVFFNRTPREVENVKTGETETVNVPFLRTFHVFNAEQVDDDAGAAPVVEVSPLERLEHAEAWFANVPADVRWGAGNPCYRMSEDRVLMPAWDDFHTPENGYATLAHELGHWTGHSTRLAREYGKRFGDHAYAAEELVAELSAAFTCATVGIDTVARTDHASYLAHWCQMLRETPAILWSVASKAQAASDLLASFQPAAVLEVVEVAA
jgi:antirestriction protein ArdC